MITKINFSLLNCYDYEDGYSYLMRDMSVQCWSGSHLSVALYIGMTFIFAWTIFFPIIIFIALYRHRNELHDTLTLKRFGLFYVGL